MNITSVSTRLFLAISLLGCGAGSMAQPSPVPDLNKIQVLLITGQHVHDWVGTTPVLKQILEDTGEFEVRITEEFRGASAATLANYDLVVVNYYDRRSDPQWRWGDTADQALVEFVKSGKGLVLYHLALGAFYGWEGFEQMSGGNWREGRGHHSPQHDFMVDIIDSEHPITRGLKLHLPVTDDELYANLIWQPEGNFHVLATAYDDHTLYPETVRQPIPGPGKDEPILWTTQFGEGRVFVTTLGHDALDVTENTFKATFARGAQWAAKGEVTLPIPASVAAPGN